MPLIKNVLGLDIGSHTIKAVELRQTLRRGAAQQALARGEDVPARCARGAQRGHLFGRAQGSQPAFARGPNGLGKARLQGVQARALLRVGQVGVQPDAPPLEGDAIPRLGVPEQGARRLRTEDLAAQLTDPLQPSLENLRRDPALVQLAGSFEVSQPS